MLETSNELKRFGVGCWCVVASLLAACPSVTATCTEDGASKCSEGQHCDEGACRPNVESGGDCDEDSDCDSAHCSNGLCCGSGTCCRTVSSCPAGQAATCDAPGSCQGHRTEPTCSEAFECGLRQVDDDTGCGADAGVVDCAPYASLRCSGAQVQTVTCPTSCQGDTECVDSAHCSDAGTCDGPVVDGTACANDRQCASGHCGNGFCCRAGDCCAHSTDCPNAMVQMPRCDDPARCQGSRGIAQCNGEHRCTSDGTVDDDAACDAQVVANTCGLFASVKCTGAVDQLEPVCPTSCATNGDCDSGAWCDPVTHVCLADLPNGGACSADSDRCQSGHCSNGACCASGDCCQRSADCSGLAIVANCDTASTCQGHRVDGVCSSSSQCEAQRADDDSACIGQVVDACGLYPSVVCSGDVTQMPGGCATSCIDDSGCDAAAHCSGTVCVIDQPQGGFCSGTPECANGLVCVDSVCCNSACTGTCQACDLPGSVGVCTPIPSGQDPDAECNAVSCAGYYHSWSGDSCRRKADVSAAVASCNGAGACRTSAQECQSSTTIGPVTLTCDAACQQPTAGTCTGTVAGACTNVNPGTQSCGTGSCLRVVNQCSNGAPATCSPGTPQAETCNQLDDNCDGTVDNGPFGDLYEPNEDCASARTLALIGSGATVSYSTMTVFGAGDVDVFSVPLLETDGTCGCGAFSSDEDYQANTTLTVPAGAGAYEVCMNTDACDFPPGYCFTVAAGATTTLSQYLDGSCLSSDSYMLYVRIRGVSAPGFQCAPYSLSIHFVSGLCR